MMRIEICGGIASGKSTLAARLADQANWPLIREKYRENPFWEKYYNDPDHYEIYKNTYFLLSHSDAIHEALASNDNIICDFSFRQDIAYIRLSKRPDHVSVLSDLHRALGAQLGLPRVLLRVQCTTDTMLNRVRHRGRTPEQLITKDFLAVINEQIDIVYEAARAEDSIRCLTVDTEYTDFRIDDAAVESIWQRLLPLLCR